MRTSEGTVKMFDAQGNEYIVDVHSIPYAPLSANGDNKVFDYMHKGQIILKQPDGTFVFRDSGLALTLHA